MARRSRASDAVLTMRHVSKSYGRQNVLNVDTLTLRRGERVVLTGSNGSGKSTLLRIIAGISIRDGGQMDRAEALSLLRIGYVPQSGGLYSDLTVQDNLTWHRRLFGRQDDDMGRKSNVSIPDELGLRPYMKKKFADLSGGYQRLAAVAAALDIKPSWLLMDEPFSGMDDDKHERVVSLLEHALESIDLFVITAPGRQELPFETRRLTLQDGRLKQ